MVINKSRESILFSLFKKKKDFLLICQALPHVMHACSSIIERNLHSIQQSISSTHPSLLITATQSRSPSIIPSVQILSTHQLLVRPSSTILNPIEIRLFHSLHYLLLYSNENHEQLLSLNIIQLFIQLFIPYIQTYIRQNEKEFLSNSELNQGMRLIWQPLFEYHQPNIYIFNTFIKSIICSNEEKYSNENRNQQQQQHRLSILIESPKEKFINEKQINKNFKKELKSSTFLPSDSDATTTHDSASDLETIETTNNKKTRAPLVHMNSICSVSESSRVTISPQSPGQTS